MVLKTLLLTYDLLGGQARIREAGGTTLPRKTAPLSERRFTCGSQER